MATQNTRRPPSKFIRQRALVTAASGGLALSSISLPESQSSDRLLLHPSPADLSFGGEPPALPPAEASGLLAGEGGGEGDGKGAVEIELLVDNSKVTSMNNGDDVTTSSDSATGTCETGCWQQRIEVVQVTLDDFGRRHQKTLRKIGLLLLTLTYVAYFLWAVILDYVRAAPLIVFSCLITITALYTCAANTVGPSFNMKCLLPIKKLFLRHRKIIKIGLLVAVLAALVLFVGFAVRPHPRQLISLVGFTFFILLLFIFSKHPAQVDIRPVAWGLGLQVGLALIVLRTTWGFNSFRFLGQQIQAFLRYSDYGAKFVFGDKFTDHVFAFQVLPVVVFFSSTISVLYHVGVMQFVIGKIAYLLQLTMKTTPTESLTAAGNIFVGQTEAPMLVRPFIKDMTKSELHAVMTAGFATIAGAVLAAYILFGVPAEHLLCASVMNAPVALAVSKLFYPETEKSNNLGQYIAMETSREKNVLEAAAGGASAAISLVANIAANLIAFLALLAFVNAAFSWLGSLVGHPELSFQLLCAYLFTPVAFLMGVDWADCTTVGELIGIKLFLNEFVAYEELARLIRNRRDCVLPYISSRSEIIATYSLCGFANLASIGIQLGGIGPMAPSRRSDLAELAIRALIAGTTVSLMTACVAGLLTEDFPMAGCGNGTAVINVTADTSTPFPVTLRGL